MRAIVLLTANTKAPFFSAFCKKQAKTFQTLSSIYAEEKQSLVFWLSAKAKQILVLLE